MRKSDEATGAARIIFVGQKAHPRNTHGHNKQSNWRILSLRNALIILSTILAMALLFAALANGNPAAAHTTPSQSDTSTTEPLPTLTPLNLDEIEIEQPNQPSDILVPEAQSQTITNQPSSVPRTEKVLATLIDFTDVAPSQRYFGKSHIVNLLNENPDSLKNFIYATSRNKVDVEFDVLDWITIDKKRTDYPLGGGSVVEDAISAMSYQADLSQYDKVMLFIFPLEEGYPGCQAYLGPVAWNTPNGIFELGATWLSGYDMSCVSKGRIAHEFGHTFGFVHSLEVSPCYKDPPVPSSLLDPTEKNDSCYDVSVCANSDCTELKTGDATIVLNSDFDMLGGDHTDRYEEFFPVHFHSAWQAQAGWLTASQVIVAIAPGEYRLTLLESLTSDPKAIKIPIGNDHRGNPQYYWLETRAYDHACRVNIRLQTSAILDDGLNHTYNFGSIVFPGRPFQDPHRGFHIEMLECAGAGTLDEEVRLKVNFSQLEVDTPVAGVFNDGETSSTLTNKSGAPITIGSASIGGRHPDSFMIRSDECSNRTLEPEASCRVTVWHVSPNPQTDNSDKHGVLKIPNSDPFAPYMTVGLLGNQPRALPRGTPTPVPTPQATLEPTPTHEPMPIPVKAIEEDCVHHREGDSHIYACSGHWDDSVISVNRPGHYANFFTFNLSEAADIAVNIGGSAHVFMLKGEGVGGESIAAGTGIGRISLSPGNYTIEATTRSSYTRGYFLMTMHVEGTAISTPMPDPTTTPTSEPTVTPTPVPGQPTATPAPTVPTEVLKRLSALETLVATLQGIISTLEGSISALNSNVSALASRVATLEADASIPTPVPTPTTVPGETPVPTPTTVPGETPVPIPTQAPVADSCLTSIPSDGAANGRWNSACTTDRNVITARAPVGTRYAGYYTFAVSQQSEVTITLESSEDTYLFLLEGTGRNGSVIEENDDIDTDAQNYNSRIVEGLAPGEYTIVATTYNLATAGDFTLTVSGLR